VTFYSIKKKEYMRGSGGGGDALTGKLRNIGATIVVAKA
jgi:hypothetical protein